MYVQSRTTAFRARLERLTLMHAMGCFGWTVLAETALETDGGARGLPFYLLRNASSSDKITVYGYCKSANSGPVQFELLCCRGHARRTTYRSITTVLLRDTCRMKMQEQKGSFSTLKTSQDTHVVVSRCLTGYPRMAVYFRA